MEINQLMPPPAPITITKDKNKYQYQNIKRQKRSILPEEDFVSVLENIVERDYFPHTKQNIEILKRKRNKSEFEFEYEYENTSQST